ncbi:hypothetical protein F0562_006877 [Nyssa sinensis]|uniref:Calmodulin-lysine N-methyltransferase n=1 Tax=Nyssa sinensis TaxID=561372 RepID=A0A5J5ASG0_9ASTE|nr:hypothetical protein F0562_006877 [Nyssa sinensis]
MERPATTIASLRRDQHFSAVLHSFLYTYANIGRALASQSVSVVISDGTLKQSIHSINANSSPWGGTKVKSRMLRWNQEEMSDASSTFDLIVTSDCTFFKEFHQGLGQL